MARDNMLQISQVTQLTLGGYGRRGGEPAFPCNGGDCYSGDCNKVEIIDGSCGPIRYDAHFVDVDDDSASGMSRTYTWRDADSMLNSSSAQGSATVRDTWTSKRNDDNSVTVTLTSTVNNISRGDIRPGTRGNRTVAIKDPSNNGATLWQGTNVNVGSFSGTLFSGSISVTRTFTIKPQQTSADTKMIIIRNWVTGAAGADWGGEPYVDEMVMGAIFKNNLPNEFEPPVLIRIDQTERICDNLVDADFYFEPPNLNGAHLELQWRYAEQDWSDDRTLNVDANVGINEHLKVYDLIPTACNVVTVYWRARFVSDTPGLNSSDYTYGEFDTLFIPTPWMTTPDIVKADCALINQGEEIPKFDHIVYYKGKPECKKGKC